MASDAPDPPARDAISSAFEDFVSPTVARDVDQAPSAGAIGAFELISVLGEGGFGVVYLARQRGALERDVALKVLRSPLVGGEALRRFERERQVLASLDHPSIAAIYEAGISDAGQPFFAMEYVAGPNLVEFCAPLTFRERLPLLIAVCTAVHHAHGRGVVHRDLKPANVLVAQLDGEPIPKVIDFGIAKLSTASDEPLALHTRFGQVLGTPEYMSPEQASGSARGLDGRSDVYSLGVILYELVTGTRPLLNEGSSADSLHEILRTIREEEPLRPSLRRAAEPRERRAACVTPPSTLVDSRGSDRDLDWVCLKALEKDPDRRYATAQDLARDLQRFLEHRPVLARPPSRVHLATKFVRRHRSLTVSAALIATALVVGITATTHSWRRALASGEEARRDRARFDGLRLAAESRLRAEEQPALAILLALEAEEGLQGEAMGAAIHEALYSALPHLTEAAVLEGHQLTTRAEGQFLRGGELVLTQTSDPTLRVWDAATAQLLRRIETGTAALNGAAVSPDERFVATASSDGRIALWELASARLVRELPAHPAPVQRLAFDPTGAVLATVGEDLVLRMFDTGDFDRPPLECKVEGACRSVRFSATGKHVAAGSRRAVQVFRVADGVQTAIVDGRSRPLLHGSQDVLAHPSDELFSVRLANEAPESSGVLILGADGERHALQQALTALAFSTDGRSLLGVRPSLDRGTELGRLDVVTAAYEPILRVPFPPDVWPLDDRRTLWSTFAHTFVVDDADPDRPVQLEGHRYAVMGAALDTHTDRVLTWSNDRTFRLWRLDPPTRPTRLPVAQVAPRNSIRLTAGGPRVLCRSIADPTLLQVIDVEDGAVMLELQGISPGHSELTSDGTRVVALPARKTRLAFRDGPAVLTVAEVATGHVRRIETGLSVSDFALADDGRTVLLHVVGEPNTLHTLDLDSAARRTYDVHPHRMKLFAGTNFAADRMIVRVGHRLGAVVRPSDGSLVAMVAGHGGDHQGYAFSADGTLLLSTGVAGEALVREVASGRTIASYRTLDGLAVDVGFLRGETMAYARSEEAIHLFDARTGEAFARITPPDGVFAGVVESADGEFLLTVTSTGGFQRWPLDPVGYARRVAPRELEPEELEQFRIGAEDTRVTRMEEQARRLGSGTRYRRIARILAQKGNLERALQLLEAGVATGTLDLEVWGDLVVLLCARAGAVQDGAERARGLARAAEVLQHATALGLDLSEALGGVDPTLLAEQPVLRDAILR